MEEHKKLPETILEEKFPDLSSVQKERFAAMEAIYREWNGKINVISRKDMDGFFLHHVLHSLSLAGFLESHLPEAYSSFISGGISVLDLGTGGGFPGIPLAVLFPDTHFTLCDSVGKKTTVASEVARTLGLENVTVVNARAESIGQKFDYAVSRAVAPLDRLLEWTKGKCSEGLLCLKGGDIVPEIAEACRHSRISAKQVHTWPVDSWANEPYFVGKLVVFIENFCK